MTIIVRGFFSASHQLPDTRTLYTKQCARLHGHTYGFIITAESDVLTDGMIVDFKAIKDLITNKLDHQHINDVFADHDFEAPSTAEMVAVFIQRHLELEFNLLSRVELCEGYKGEESTSWVTIKPGERGQLKYRKTEPNEV